MSNFETVMDDLTSFIQKKPTSKLQKAIKKTADNQRAFKSNHKYDLEKFGLTEKQIKKDCAKIYKTFLS